MKVRHTKKPLPRNWHGLPGADRALMIADIRVTPRSRLYMKLLVFENNADLRNFWKRGIQNSSLCRRTLGVVNGLAYEIQTFTKGSQDHQSRMEVDPRYFCVMGLTKKHLTMEVICHESIHAGFAYTKRVGKRNLWWSALDFDEEDVCYPSGRIAKEVVNVLRESGLITPCPPNQTA